MTQPQRLGQSHLMLLIHTSKVKVVNANAGKDAQHTAGLSMWSCTAANSAYLTLDTNILRGA